jgi:hypothetical protein
MLLRPVIVRLLGIIWCGSGAGLTFFITCMDMSRSSYSSKPCKMLWGPIACYWPRSHKPAGWRPKALTQLSGTCFESGEGLVAAHAALAVRSVVCSLACSGASASNAAVVCTSLVCSQQPPTIVGFQPTIDTQLLCYVHVLIMSFTPCCTRGYDMHHTKM